MREIEKIFNEKQTENGDKAYLSTGDRMLDIMFMTSYYEKHLKELPRVGTSNRWKLFSMFVRDPRYGLGRRDLGRCVIDKAFAVYERRYKDLAKAGRYDDLLWYGKKDKEALFCLFDEARKGNELAKKWCPRFNSKDKALAKKICKLHKISQKEYRRIIKCDTVENKLSHNRIDEIEYEHVPSLAMIKYYNRFMREDRFQEYLEAVKSNKKDLKVSTTTVYDIYRNQDKIDADLFFDKLEKIKINCIPILDTSGSMCDCYDSIGKANSIAHYLAKNSTYFKDRVISFSSRPKLLEIKGKTYREQIQSMHTGDCSNTDLAKVMNMLAELDKDLPQYLVILSDMEFDEGSYHSRDYLERLWKEKGYKTKIIWWNFNERNTTVPEMKDNGNIYISGYSPYLLKFLDAGFDGVKFLNALLDGYEKNIKKEFTNE